MQFLSILIILNVLHQIISLAQAHEPVKMSHTMFMFVVQFEILLLFTLIGIESVNDILIKISLLTSNLDALIVTCNAIGVDVAKTRQFGCINDNDSTVTITVIDICQTVGGRLWVAFFVAVIYFMMQLAYGSSLNMAVPIKFAVFMVAITGSESNLAAPSMFNGIVIIVSKTSTIDTKYTSISSLVDESLNTIDPDKGEPHSDLLLLTNRNKQDELNGICLNDICK